MVTESSSTEAMALGLRGENLVGKSLDNIVGSLWQARSSGSSLGNQSPRNGEEMSSGSDPEDNSPGTVRLKDTRDLLRDDRPAPGEGTGGFLLPQFPPGGFEAAAAAGLSREFLSAGGFLSSTPPPPSSTGGYPYHSPNNNNSSSLSKDRGISPASPGGGDNSQQNWSFEEQFKQLYEIDENPKRKVFLDELFSLMTQRGTPINRLPIMAKQVLDLYELYNLVLARGGLVEVINKKLWQEVIKGLGLPSSITSAAFTLRTQYTKYLYPLECRQRNLSNPSELQMAIEGNKREGRRSGAYAAAAAQETLQRFPGDPLSALEMTRLALWKMYNGVAPEKPLKRHLEEESGQRSPKRHQSEEHQLEDVPEDIPEEQLQETRPRQQAPNLPQAPLNEDAEEEEEVEIEVRDSPRKVTNLNSLPGANIKIASRGDGKSKDSSLVVSMEINGISYQGVLFAQAAKQHSASSLPSNHHSSSTPATTTTTSSSS